MARDGYLILDSDLHMMEPDDLWARYLGDPHRARLFPWLVVPLWVAAAALVAMAVALVGGR